MPVPAPIRTEIMHRMHAAEAEHGVRILLAVRWLERYGTAAPIEFRKLLISLTTSQHL